MLIKFEFHHKTQTGEVLCIQETADGFLLTSHENGIMVDFDEWEEVLTWIDETFGVFERVLFMDQVTAGFKPSK